MCRAEALRVFFRPDFELAKAITEGNTQMGVLWRNSYSLLLAVAGTFANKANGFPDGVFGMSVGLGDGVAVLVAAIGL